MYPHAGTNEMSKVFSKARSPQSISADSSRLWRQWHLHHPLDSGKLSCELSQSRAQQVRQLAKLQQIRAEPDLNFFPNSD